MAHGARPPSLPPLTSPSPAKPADDRGPPPGAGHRARSSRAERPGRPGAVSVVLAVRLVVSEGAGQPVAQRDVRRPAERLLNLGVVRFVAADVDHPLLGR